jgi:HAE1 family hydrophobic/amphiphilic exporter-1
MKLAKLAVERPVTMYMLFLGIILLGVISLRELSVDLLPDISYPRLSVVTQYPGVAPEEMEKLVTIPLEARLSGLPGRRRIESVSKEGISYLNIEFDWGTDMDFALLHTREQLDAARESLPEDVEAPRIILLDPQSKPILTLAVTGDRSLLELKEFAEELVKPRLEQIEGIGSAELTGGVEREIQVEVDPQKMALFGLTIAEVSGRIDAFNRNLQGGTIRKGTFKYSLRVVGEFESLAEIEEINIKTLKGGGVIRLRDVAKVQDGIRERQGLTRLNGKESIGLQVRKESGANTVKVTQAARVILDLIRKENPNIGLKVIGEQSRFIEAAISAVKSEIFQGAILAFFVLFLFLQEWKTPLIIDTVIPISVIGTFSLMYFNNITLNIMSLGGLALGVGMLDDCAVVVSENIFRHRGLGKSLKEAAYDGTKEVGGAIVSTALTTVVVFLPVIYVHGVAGQLFKDTALTVTYSLLASLFVSLTLIGTLQARTFDFAPKAGEKPWRWTWGLKRFWGNKAGGVLLWPFRALRWLVYTVFKSILFILNWIWSYISQLLAFIFHYLGMPFRPILKLIFRGFNAVYGRFMRFNDRALIWCLDHKARVLTGTFVAFGLIFLLGLTLRRELMPKMETNAFEVFLRTPVDYSLDQTAAMTGLLEERMRTEPSVVSVMSQIGLVSGLEAADPNVSINSSRVYVEVDKPARVAGVLESVRRTLSEFPDLNYSIVQEQSLLGQFLAVGTAEIGLRIKGSDLERLKEIAGSLMGKLRGIPGIADLSTNLGEGKPEFRISVRKEALRKYANLSPNAVGDYLVNAVNGRKATDFTELEKKFEVRVRAEGAAQRNIEALLSESYPHQGTLIPIRDLVDHEIVRGPREIRREDQQREILVTANLKGTKISQVQPAIEQAIASLDLPSEYRVVFGGEREEMTKSFNSLIFALGLAILLTYMIMAAQFESLMHPLLIMFTLPMGVAGSILAMALTGQTINVISIIGMVVLVGLVVDNAIVKIDYTNQLRKAGAGLREAVAESSQVRLRPILMSTLSTLFGLIPMALGLEAGAELMQPLAIVVIGGLTVSTFLTLLLIPVLYEAVEERKERKRLRSAA